MNSSELKCAKCGQGVDEVSQRGAYLTRTNPKGEEFIGVCAPSCEHHNGDANSAVMAAVCGGQEDSLHQDGYGRSRMNMDKKPLFVHSNLLAKELTDMKYLPPTIEKRMLAAARQCFAGINEVEGTEGPGSTPIASRYYEAVMVMAAIQQRDGGEPLAPAQVLHILSTAFAIEITGGVGYDDPEPYSVWGAVVLSFVHSTAGTMAALQKRDGKQ